MSGKPRAALLATVLGVLLITAPGVVAHHSVSSEYDFDKPIELTGVLTKLDWVNPHSMFHLEVTGPDGSKTVWLMQTGAAGQMRRTKEFIGKQLVGKPMTIIGVAARSGKPAGFIKTVKLYDGQEVTLWWGDPNG